MSEQDARTKAWRSEKDRKRDQRRQGINRVKRQVKLFFFGLFWRTLHFTRLARPYSVFMCRTRLYRKFPDGRCMWCGEKK